MGIRLTALARAQVFVCILGTHGLWAQSWVQMQPGTPPPPGRINNTAVYDPGSDRLIVFGGFSSADCCVAAADLWILTNANKRSGQRDWIRLSPSNPPPATAAASAVYDAANNRMIVFGGQAYGRSSNDVWVLTNANGLGGAPRWTQVQPAVTEDGAPLARQNHQAAYDPLSNRMIVFGGLQNSGGDPVLLNDGWVLTNANGLGGEATWTRISTMNKPSPRHGFAIGYLPSTDRLLLFGGCTDPTWGCGQTSQELWALSNASGRAGAGSAWTAINYDQQNAPAGAQFASSAYDVSNNRLYLMGARSGSGTPPSFGMFRDDTWVLTSANGLSGTPKWTRMKFSKTPGPRGQSVTPSLFDAQRRQFIVFGGPGLNDLWTLQIN